MTEPAAALLSSVTSEHAVDPDAAAAYALATNDVNPRYQDGRAVPPLFTATVVLRVEQAQETLLRETVSTVGESVHGEHDVFFRRPVRPSMVVRCSVAGTSAHQTRAGALTTTRIVVADEEGDALVEHLWTTFHIGGTVAREVGPPLPDHTFPEAARHRPVGRSVVTVDRDQTFRYAGVSGDHIGHAVSDAVAQAEGYPGKILQGMCTFGLASGAVVDIVADGDPDRLRRLAVRFARPAFPCKDLEINVYDAGRNDDGDRVFAFEGVQDGIAVLRHGRVEVASAR
jgi:acyl dehydratase